MIKVACQTISIEQSRSSRRASWWTDIQRFWTACFALLDIDSNAFVARAAQYHCHPSCLPLAARVRCLLRDRERV
jgi:hypothetical protein